MAHIMALDQGTSSSRAIIYAQNGEAVASSQHAFDMTFPSDGWVEQDPEVLWQTTLTAGREAIGQAGIEPEEIAAIGITNQRETTLVWDRADGTCPYNAIVWQDRRTADRCEAMASDDLDGRPLADFLVQHTGLVIDPYFSATKLAWMLEEVAGLRDRAEAGEIRFGTVDSFLIWRLTKGRAHVTEASNASRTQLFDIHDRCWSDALLAYHGLPESLFPEVLDSAAEFGVADAEWFGAEIPICGVAGDQQAALVGQGCFAPGMSKSTFGTGCFIMTNTGAHAPVSQQKLLTTIAYSIGGQATYALEGSIFIAGVAVKWLQEQLGLINDAAETQTAFERTGGNAGGVYVVPAFTGLGAPHWRPDVRGAITGLTLDTNRDQLVTAFLQAVVYQAADLLDAMAADGAPVERIRVDGGMVVNDALCQFLADILGVDVERPVDVETTARGAAVLAGIGSGLLGGFDEAAQLWKLDRAFVSKMDDFRREALRRGFQNAVAALVGA